MAASLLPEDPRFHFDPFRERFTIKYAISDETFPHSIDAEALATSISGISKALKSLSSITIKTKLWINVTANKKGSFETTIEIIGVTSGVLGVLQFFGYDYKKIKSLVSGLLLHILKCICEKVKPTNGEIDRYIEIVNEDEMLTDAEKEILIDAMSRAKIRNGLDDFTKPLENKNISNIEIHHEKKSILKIEKKDRRSFILKNVEERSTTTEIKSITIVYLSPTKTKWQFKSGQQDFWAEVEDIDFLSSTKDTDIAELENVHFIATITTITTRKKGAKRSLTERIVSDVVRDERNLLTI